MRVGIDYTSAAHQGAGIGRLTRNVVHTLAEIDQENEYTLLIRGRELPFASQASTSSSMRRNRASGIANTNFREVRTRIDERWWDRIWYRLRLPVRVEWVIGAQDLFHSPDFTLPPVRRSTRTIVTIHDLSFLTLPECFEPALRSFLTAQVPLAVQRADWVLADSEHTRQDVIELLGAQPDRISVLYPGVEPRFGPIYDPEVLERTRLKHGLPPHFVLSVGTVQPRKNYSRLIEAFARMDISDLWLVIVGAKGWLYQSTLERVEELGLQERVLLVGYLNDMDLPIVYNLAQVFAMPSLYEGFGIPALESMACGTPVITSDNSSLPEVVADAGLMVGARDIDALADAMSQLLSDDTLRQTLRERGLQRSSQFTWKRAAVELLETYRHVASL